jgi:hypothetical protein
LCWAAGSLALGVAVMALGYGVLVRAGRGNKPPVVGDVAVRTADRTGATDGAGGRHRPATVPLDAHREKPPQEAWSDHSKPPIPVEAPRVEEATPIAPPAPAPAVVSQAERGKRRVSLFAGRLDPNADSTRPGATAGSEIFTADNVRLPVDSWFAVADPDESNAFPKQCAAGVCGRDRSLGTKLVWATSPEEAAKQAEESGKLVLVLHVSGNFENPGFT